MENIKFGGWVIEENPTVGVLPQNLATGFFEATKELVGIGLTPLLYCAHQLVNGTNYLLSARQQL